MITKHHKLLHYVLIILLMFAPLRSVFSAQLMVCEMNASSPMQNMKMMDSVIVDDGSEAPSGKIAKNCCGNDGACKGDCHFALSASLLIQGADYSPVLLNIDTFDTISSAVLVREIIPPSRPPLSLYS